MTSEDGDNRGGTTEMNDIYIIYVSIPMMAAETAQNIIYYFIISVGSQRGYKVF